VANIKSQKKRVLTNEKAHQRNRAVKSELKTAIKEGKKRRELDKRTETPTGLEVDLWDEMFRSKP